MNIDDAQEPIAIIGMSCRFPGEAVDPASFWNLLAQGRDAIVEVPDDRWNLERFYDPDPKMPGKMYVRTGGFLKQRFDQFDAAFFGMSPREAEYLDPQQRLLLEVAWEAVEDAGIVPARLAGSNTGVYIGAFMLDGLMTQFSPLNRRSIGQHSAISSTMTILSNRLSYLFDLRGPSITMDTACSSSLVALHQACQALWHNECLLAFAGGVNVMHRPEPLIAMCKGGFLSPDGRCKSFDARADGYGRGEGAGIVMLKRLGAAVKDADEIHALVLGTGANQDGRTEGITVPNPAAQEALMRKVCEQTRISPRRIRYIEAHGTGTAVGDPIEAAALGAVIGEGRTKQDEACPVGSVKANIGHLEAAAGIAGIIKLALCLKHRQIPPLANLKTPNPAIPFQRLGLRLPLVLEPMPEDESPACVAINSFGYGGTNAHAILQEAPRREEAAEEHATGLHLLLLSARAPAALHELAAAYLSRLEASDAPGLHDLCYSAALRRAHLEHRLALVADSPAAMRGQLQCFIAQERATGIANGTSAFKGSKPVFVFTGMGPQWWAMGRELLQHEPEFRSVAEQCDALFQHLAGWSILPEMAADQDRSRMAETHIAQPANFIMQVGLAALWRSWGVEAAAVVGHSVGEVAAAYVAGALDLESAVRVAYHRSRVQKKAAGLGAMLAVGLSALQAQAFLMAYDGVSLAAVNGPASVTLSGDADELAQIAKALQARDVFNRLLQVEVAYHSSYMDGPKLELLDSLHGLQPQAPQIPLYSTVTGDRVEQAVHDPDYWCRNMRDPVRFADAVDSLIRDGHRVFVEVGPHPVLSTSIQQCLSQRKAEGIVLPSLRREQPERFTLSDTLAGLYAAGCPIDWGRRYAHGGRYVRLPTYPWQRETYWREDEEARADRVAQPAHPLLGLRMALPTPSWKGGLSRHLLPYVVDHQVEGMVVLPGAAYVELGLAVHHAVGEQGPAVLDNLEFHKALVVESQQEAVLFTTFNERTRDYAVYSQQGDDKSWYLHARGTVSSGAPSDIRTPAPADLQARMTEAIDAADHYRDMRRRSLHYGPCFQGVRALWRHPNDGEILARIEGHESVVGSGHRHHLHPALLDACFQALLASVDIQEDDRVYVPVSIRQVEWHRPPESRFWCHGRRVLRTPDMIEGDVTLFDETGILLAELRGIRAKALSRREQASIDDIDRWLYRFDWQTAEPDAPSAGAGRWLLFMDAQGVALRLVDKLRAGGVQEIICVQPGDTFGGDGDTYSIRLDCKADIVRLLTEATVDRLDGIAYFWGLDAQGTDADPVCLPQTATAVMLVQALAQTGGTHAPRLVFITRYAQCGLPADSAVSLGQTPLIGLVRVAINEHAELRFRILDIDDSAEAPTWLAKEMLAKSREEEVALRAGQRYVPRLIRWPVQELDTASAKAGSIEAGSSPQAEALPLFRADACYLVSGGFGGFGLTLARWMVTQGARHLVLVGRRGAGTPEAARAVKALQSAGAQVLAAAADIADESQVRQLLAEVARELPPLKGVFHAAAVLEDGPISRVDRQALDNVLQPKAVGAWHLHQATLELPLDYFVLFSSIASLLGSPGQVSYVMANTFLDALAHHRRTHNKAAISVNWGALAQVGMVARHEEVQRYFQHVGVGSFTPPQAMKILERILRWNPIGLCPSIMEWRSWGEFNPPWAASPRYRHLMDYEKRQGTGTIDAMLLDRLSALAEEDREEFVLKVLTELASGVLKLPPERLDPSQSLFNVGMDSLMAIEFQMEIEERFGIKVSVLELMKGNSLKKLARHLLSQGDLANASVTAPRPHHREPLRRRTEGLIDNQKEASQQIERWPVSRGQNAIWSLYHSAPESAAYNVGFAIRIRSVVDVAALHRACQALVDRHDMLRATFRCEDGVLRQEIASQQEVSFATTDVAELNEAALEACVVTVHRRPFDLAQGPVFRVHLFTSAADEHVLLLTAHHIVFDGWSLWITLDELRQLYIAEAMGLPPALPPRRGTYRAYIERQEAVLASARGGQLWNFWRDEIAGASSVLNLPFDRPRPPVKTYRGTSHPFALSRETTLAVKELAKSKGTTPFAALLAAFQVLLGRETAEEDFLVISRFAGRSDPDFADVIGDFSNSVLLRANLQGDPSVTQLIQRVRDTVLRVWTHQDYPFSLLVERLQPQRHASRSPLAKVGFVFQKDHRGQAGGLSEQRFNWGKLELQNFPLAQQEDWHDLELEMFEAQGIFKGSFKYNTDLFDASTIARIADHFQTVLQAMLANPGVALSAVFPALAGMSRSPYRHAGKLDLPVPIAGPFRRRS